jgi:predicted RNase H-like HicB family nuclease
MTRLQAAKCDFQGGKAVFRLTNRRQESILVLNMASKEQGIRKFKVLLEWDAADEVWVSYVPALGHLSTYGDSRQDALAKTEEAILGYLEALAKEEMPLPVEVETEIVELEVAAP